MRRLYESIRLFPKVQHLLVLYPLCTTTARESLWDFLCMWLSVEMGLLGQWDLCNDGFVYSYVEIIMRPI